MPSARSDHTDEQPDLAGAPGTLSAPPLDPPFERDAILELVDRLLAEIVGEDYDLCPELEMELSISDDLELESLEFVQVGERLQEIYGERVDFVAWFSDLDVDAIIDLTVGDLVELIERSR